LTRFNVIILILRLTKKFHSNSIVTPNAALIAQERKVTVTSDS